MTVRGLMATTGLSIAALMVMLYLASNPTIDSTASLQPVLAPAVIEQPTPEQDPLAPTPTAIPFATATPEPTATPDPTPTPVPREVTLSFSGDILSHMPVIRTAQALGGNDLAYDYRPMFALVRDRLVSADLALCVLETPLSSDNGDLSGYPAFNAPADLADALVVAGYDGCATASNHSLDRGETGVIETLTELDRVGLGHAGMARTAEEAAEPRIYDVQGVQVAHLSFSYGLNGFVPPASKEWMVNVTDPALVLDAAADARAAGAEIVVLMIQWGDEYVTDPTPEQSTLAEIFAASPDIDLIVGNHAHVVQPVADVAGTPVIYGLGNFLSNQPAPGYPARTQDGMIVEVTFVDSAAGVPTLSNVTVVPTWVDKSTYTIVPVNRELSLETSARDRGTLETSLERTTEAVSRLGYPLTFE